MDKIRAVIIDDELSFIKTLKILLADHPQVDVIGEARSVRQGQVLIKDCSPDLVFLDIKMDDGSGFDLLSKFDNISFKIVFVTAYDTYAVRAFQVNAIDYLLKPITEDRLNDCITNVIKNVQTISTSEIRVLLNKIGQHSTRKNVIVLKELDMQHVTRIEDLIWCEAVRGYTRFHLVGGATILTSRHLKEYEDKLRYDGFFRVHRSYLVNLNKVKRFDKSDGGVLHLEEGHTVPVSFRKKDKLSHALNAL